MGTVTKRKKYTPMAHWGSVVGEKSANILRIVGNNLNGLRPCNFGNKELEPLKDALRNPEEDVKEFQ